MEQVTDYSLTFIMSKSGIEFQVQMERLRQHCEKFHPELENEEQTKHALVIPFIRALGYSSSHPGEVKPEFTADIGRKSDKVDYALLSNGQPVVLIECKKFGASLGQTESHQLWKYFNATDSALWGVLTDGNHYKFYTDTKRVNKMDDEPIWEFMLVEHHEDDLDVLARFRKGCFDARTIKSHLVTMNSHAAVKKMVIKDLDDVSDDYVGYIISRIRGMTNTSNNREELRPIVRAAIRELGRRKFNEILLERVKYSATLNRGRLSMPSYLIQGLFGVKSGEEVEEIRGQIKSAPKTPQ